MHEQQQQRTVSWRNSIPAATPLAICRRRRQLSGAARGSPAGSAASSSASLRDPLAPYSITCGSEKEGGRGAARRPRQGRRATEEAEKKVEAGYRGALARRHSYPASLRGGCRHSMRAHQRHGRHEAEEDEDVGVPQPRQQFHLSSELSQLGRLRRAAAAELRGRDGVGDVHQLNHPAPRRLHVGGAVARPRRRRHAAAAARLLQPPALHGHGGARPQRLEHRPAPAAPNLLQDHHRRLGNNGCVGGEGGGAGRGESFRLCQSDARASAAACSGAKRLVCGGDKHRPGV